jgi:hypothetical protein
MLRLFSHYGCEYAIAKLHDIRFSHVPVTVVRADSDIVPFAEKAMCVRGARLCGLSLDRPIPVIITPLPDEEPCEHRDFMPRLTAFVGVPIIVRGDYVGALGMFWTTRPCDSSILGYAAADEVARAVGALLEN